MHPPQPSKGIGMWIFFPFLEVFEMTESAFSVANVVGRLFSKDVAGVWLDEECYQTKENCLNDQDNEQPDGQRRFRHFRDPEAQVIPRGLKPYRYDEEDLTKL